MRFWHTAGGALVAVLVAIGSLGAPSSAAEEKQPSGAARPKADAKEHGSDAKTAEKGKSTALTVYVPRSRGSVGARTSGGTRIASGAPRIAVLVPDHVGLTTRERPTLAWYLSGDTEHPVEFSLIADGAVATTAVAMLKGPLRAGIHLLNLADYGARLDEGITYDWYVSLVLDPDARDTDVVAGGKIERVSTGADLGKDLLAAGEPSYRLLARNGVWYDAIADLSAAIDAAPAGSPTGRELRSERAALLEQVGVAAAAVYDREGGE